MKETKRQGRIAHHHADATVPHIVALLGFAFLLRTSAIQASLIALGLASVGFSFHAANVRQIIVTSKYIGNFFAL